MSRKSYKTKKKLIRKSKRRLVKTGGSRPSPMM